jgi:magnesium transporter
MITSVVLEEGRKLVKNPSLASLKKMAKSTKNTVWIDLQDASDREYEFIRKTFDLHPLSIEDCKQNIELPKIERFRDYIYVVFHMVDYNKKRREIEMIEIDSFLGKNFIITEHKGNLYSVERLRNILLSKSDLMKKGPDFLLHNLVDYTIDQYLPLLDSWDEEIESLEDKIIAGETEGALEKLVDFRRRVSEFKRSIAPQRHTIYKLTKSGDYAVISSKVALYFRDVFDHIIRAQGILESQRDLVGSAFSAYSSHASNEMNDIMKTLTLVATIMMPLTLIAGIYGMNFRFMPELMHPLGYVLVLIAMLIIGIGMMAYFKKKGWM